VIRINWNAVGSAGPVSCLARGDPRAPRSLVVCRLFAVYLCGVDALVRTSINFPHTPRIFWLGLENQFPTEFLKREPLRRCDAPMPSRLVVPILSPDYRSTSASVSSWLASKPTMLRTWSKSYRLENVSVIHEIVSLFKPEATNNAKLSKPPMAPMAKAWQNNRRQPCRLFNKVLHASRARVDDDRRTSQEGNNRTANACVK